MTLPDTNYSSQGLEGLTAHVGKRIAQIRRYRGLSQERLSEEMKKVGVPCPRIVIAKLEKGYRRFVTLDELLGLSLVLQVDLNDLVGEAYREWWAER